jgi:microcystin-dependent protein
MSFREKMKDGTTRISGLSMADIFAAVYPVGSIHMSVTNVNPSAQFGGTWVAWGSGRVPVGVDTAQTEFDTVEETGGEKTHVLTAAEMPQHLHAAGTLATGSAGGHNHNVDANWTIGILSNTTTGGTANRFTNASDGNNRVTSTDGAHTHPVTGNTGQTGGNGAHNNLQPYITCYMWKRTA